MSASPSGETTIFTTTTTGSIQLYKGPELQWVREEALATTVLVEFVELPERVAVESDLPRDESFAHRIGRQIIQAQVRFFLRLSKLEVLFTNNTGLPAIPPKFHKTIRNWVLRICNVLRSSLVH